MPLMVMLKNTRGFFAATISRDRKLGFQNNLFRPTLWSLRVRNVDACSSLLQKKNTRACGRVLTQYALEDKKRKKKKEIEQKIGNVVPIRSVGSFLWLPDGPGPTHYSGPIGRVKL
jgi:hypothetical protein